MGAKVAQLGSLLPMPADATMSIGMASFSFFFLPHVLQVDLCNRE